MGVVQETLVQKNQKPSTRILEYLIFTNAISRILYFSFLKYHLKFQSFIYKRKRFPPTLRDL